MLRFTFHAEEQMLVRELPRDVVLDTIENPQQRVATRTRRLIYQSQYFDPVEQRVMLIRAIVEADGGDLIVISVYKTSKIEKYWLRAGQG